MTYLVEHGRPFVANHVTKPAGFDLGRDRREHLGPFPRQQLRIFQPIEIASDRVELLQDRPPPRFAGMRVKTGRTRARLNNAAIFSGLKPRSRSRTSAISTDSGNGCPGFCSARVSQRPDAGLLFGEVNQIEIQAESPRQRAQSAQVECCESIAQLLRAASTDGVARNSWPAVRISSTNWKASSPSRRQDRFVEHLIKHACVKLQARFVRSAVPGRLSVQIEPAANSVWVIKASDIIFSISRGNKSAC